jgi:uroporphyrinogen decarboxylase
MDKMTGIERIGNILKRQPVDRIGVFEKFWSDTQKKWQKEHHIRQGESLEEHFDLDMRMFRPFNMIADISFEPQTVEETEDTILQRDGNGALLRRHKLHDATPEHVDFMVKERAAWEEKIKPLLVPSRERLNIEGYKQAREEAARNKRFFCWEGHHAFELMFRVCGHEYLLMGAALDPDWVKDMVGAYANLTIGLMEILFAEAGRPDGIWFYEDLGFKQKPFISPDMYRDLIQPGHKKTFDFAHSLSLPVIVHSCGYVEPLIPGLIEAGMNCLQVIEVKAGMDLLKLKNDFGDRIALCGGMDTRNLAANDLDEIARELHAKIPTVKQGGGYILHSDHSIPDQCRYETYQYFLKEGLKLGTC